MKKLLCSLLVIALALPSLALADGVVNVFNWEDYIDEAVLQLFEEETGIKVNYMCFTQNEDMIVQVEANPGAFDLVFPSEYMVERMIRKGLLSEINMANVPNFRYISEDLRNPSYDANNAHSVPYMWGTLGILYNTTMVDEPVDSWSILFDEKYRDKYQDSIFMMDSLRDGIGLALRYLGYSLNTDNYMQLDAAAKLLIAQKQSGVVKAYQMDEIKDKMVAGEGALAVMYSGDAQYSIDLNEDLAYAIPREGSNIWVDCMVIPATAKNKENAEKLIDFLCRPDIAKMNCEYIWYSSPNTAAIELMGDEYTQNTVMNPASEDVAVCEYYHDLSESALVIWNTLWQQVKNAK